jgi:hypothetical protein
MDLGHAANWPPRSKELPAVGYLVMKKATARKGADIGARRSPSLASRIAALHRLPADESVKIRGLITVPE